MEKQKPEAHENKSGAGSTSARGDGNVKSKDNEKENSSKQTKATSNDKGLLQNPNQKKKLVTR